MYTTRQKEINVVETDCIHVEMEELTNAINLVNAYPVLDEVGERNKPFRFKLTNTCGVGVNYNLNLEVMESEKRVASKNIAVKVDELEKTILTNNPTTEVTYEEEDYTGVEAYTIHQGELKPGESITHELRLWLDANAGNDSQNGKFYSKVIIESFQNQIGIIKMSDYIISLSDTNSTVKKYTHTSTSQTGTNALEDYRYSGAAVNNYICFKEGECSESELYRIIGVIPTQSSASGIYENRVKVIKATPYEGTKYLQSTSAGKGYSWNETINNVWYSSTIHNVLNTEYYQSLADIQNLIDPTKWYLGAPSYKSQNDYSAEDIFIQERSNSTGYNGGSLYGIDYIGLMYPSDYGYSVSSETVDDIYHKPIGSNGGEYKRNSWLYVLNDTRHEWLISPEKDISPSIGNAAAWLIGKMGNILSTPVNANSFYVRPTFNLKASLEYKSGVGTKENPYRINK